MYTPIIDIIEDGRLKRIALKPQNCLLKAACERRDYLRKYRFDFIAIVRSQKNRKQEAA